MLWISLFLLLTIAEVTVLLGIIAGRPWLVCSLDAMLARVVPGLSMLYLCLCRAATDDLRRADFGAALKVVEADEGVANAMSTPAILFGALLAQGIMQVLSSTRQLLAFAPALLIQLITLFYYAAECVSPSCGLVSRWPTAQGTLVPLHYALWLSSVSNQVLTLFALERSLFSQHEQRSAKGSATAGADHRNCCVALLAVMSMLWCAAIGDAYQGSVATAVLWMLASFSSFYALIVTGIWMPLRTCQMRAHRSDDPARKHSASRFLSVTAYLSLIWHGFPAIWLANVLGLTTDMHFRLAFVVMDVLAKFLPPSLYLAVATTP